MVRENSQFLYTAFFKYSSNRVYRFGLSITQNKH